LTRLGINFNQLAEALKNLTAIGSAIRVHSQNVNDPTQEVLISRRYWDETEDKLMDIISNYHKSNPLKPGISKEEVRSKLAVSIPFFRSIGFGKYQKPKDRSSWKFACQTFPANKIQW